ncbi:hypothetical protein B0T16DRAFT_37290 [Cercophora newfieldiana]|uniref:Uncharacterized protein n=1 Tax=Cercophora newfieldiana TaxID=92897 RepID=A0AA39YPQ7_9PEZI|nr:hypothetical protein B0T16DRAFT_37290 [Cercophora newfieldiana]
MLHDRGWQAAARPGSRVSAAALPAGKGMVKLISGCRSDAFCNRRLQQPTLLPTASSRRLTRPKYQIETRSPHYQGATTAPLSLSRIFNTNQTPSSKAFALPHSNPPCLATQWRVFLV